MPIKVNITDGGLGFIMEGEGVLTGQELLDAVNERFSPEERIRKYIYGISDYTAVESNKISSSAVKRVANRDRKAAAMNPDIVFSIVAPEDSLYGLSRMFGVHAEDTGWDIAVFRSLEEAKTWVAAEVKKKHGLDVVLNFS